MMKFVLFVTALVGMVTISQAPDPEGPQPTMTLGEADRTVAAAGTVFPTMAGEEANIARNEVEVAGASRALVQCSQFRDMAAGDRFRRSLGIKKRVFTKFCDPTPQTVIDNYCQCGVVPRSIDDDAFVADKVARSFLRQTETKNVDQECCTEACNLEEVRELANNQC